MINIFTIIGLSLSVCGSYILIKHLFISDKEIQETEELPIYAQGTKTGTPPRNVAGVDLKELKEFRSKFLTSKITQRTNGRTGLILLLFGFIFQLVAPAIEVIKLLINLCR